MDSPSTSHIELGAERRSADSCGYEIKDIRNPDGRIPEHIPVRSKEEETIAEAGNPDIRVPNSLNREDGLRARGAPNTRDAEGGEDEQGGEQLNEGRGVTHGQTLVEEQPNTGQDDSTTGQDGPKKLERRHVPGGTWLSQRVGYLRIQKMLPRTLTPEMMLWDLSIKNQLRIYELLENKL
ncbi:hypothetical protein NDU88_005501 [Pleurodeles waltl]|uniref:Uncharacterized protein n=1 Tax=Pleurodeles waltl TaxID=8319 RepID=A0AAV7SLZ0_PLEWA|nr:hypothetical protein NDU88_005501 [Pleurodeles waltl]